MVIALRKRNLPTQQDSSIRLPGYSSLELIFESPRSQVFRARKDRDGQLVILKLLQEDYLERSEIVRYKNQYEILADANLNHVPKILALEKYHNRPMLVFEDSQSYSLRSIIDQKIFNVPEALQVGMKIADALIEIHSNNIIHKDINPSNILYNAQNGVVEIIDFGISTKLLREHTSRNSNQVTEGSLPYMSPEQTGRMNRFLDSRTDLYSFGITLYEIFTGKLPFVSEDPIQLIHFHIAKRPTAPHDIDKGIPDILSDIIMKLLNKNVEERYQSAWGVKADLKKCAEALDSSGYVRNFPLGMQDISDQLRITQNLYGREKELGILQQCHDKVVKGEKQAVFIGGYPGTGKSSLTKELAKQISSQNSLFIQGKYEKLKRSVPYSALSEALRELCRSILSEKDYKLNEWKLKIQKVVGDIGQVLLEIVPDLELILGPQKPAPVLGATESENRFIVLFKNFVKIFACEDQPLIMYLDDLQWIDLSSVKLLEKLLHDNELHYFYFIGAYRNKDVGPTHPLAQFMEDMDDSHDKFMKLDLSELNLEQLNQMLADTLHMPRESTEQLSQLVFQKTGGNPFFTEEFLKNLYANKLLFFNPEKGQWAWNLEQIKIAGLTDNVVDLMTERINRLGDKTIEIVKLASCIGASFDMKTLSKVSGENSHYIAKSLHPAIEEGLIIPLGESYRLIELDIHVGEHDIEIEYRFAHDRILQAAYDLIPSRKRKFVRRKVAQTLLEIDKKNKRDEHLFNIVNHFNSSLELVHEEKELVELLELNLQAAEKAKNSSAYPLAFEYLNKSYSRVTEGLWNKNYELLLKFCQNACEVSFLSGKHEEMDFFGQLVLEKSSKLLEKIPIYETQVQAAIARNDMSAAVEQGKRILTLLGVNITNNPSILRILWGFGHCWWKLIGVSSDKIISMPAMVDPLRLARVHFQYTLSQCIFLYMPKQVPLSICDSVLNSLKHGIAPTSALAFTNYGIMIAGIFGAYEKGYSYGELGIKLYEKMQTREVEATILVSFNLYLRPWKEPIRGTLPSLIRAYQSGVDSGNVEFAVHGAMGYCYRSFLAGVEIPTVLKDFEKYHDAIKTLDHKGNTYILDLYRQAVFNYSADDQSIVPWRLKGDFYDDDEMCVVHRQNGDAPGLFLTYFMKMMLAYTFEQYELAHEWSNYSKQEFKAGIGTYNGTVFFFYRALTLISRLSKLPSREAKSALKEIRKIYKKFKVWRHFCQENQGQRYLLLKAEMVRLEGKSFQAQQLYDEAIAMARANQFLQDEALGNELSARFHLSENRLTMAIAYMKRARYAYQKWGANRKVMQLESDYPHLINSLGERHTPGSLATMSSSTIDITTLKKALLAIAEETIHSRMLEKIISSAIEFAGAQKGVLLLKKDGKFHVEAEGSVDMEIPKILQSIPVEKSDSICVRLINYAQRTLKAIVIDNAMEENDILPALHHESYIINNGVRSILCMPITVGGKEAAEVVGLLYLENNRAANSFTAERIETLEIICLSAAGRLELSVKAATDGLTGLYNHDYFQSMLEQEILQSQRQQRNLSLIMIDIDHFKSFNDQWGHQVGDQVLKHVANLIKQTCRKSDIVARYGGEELSVILPETTFDLAMNVADRIRTTIEENPIEHEGEKLGVTASLGVSYLHDEVRSAEILVRRADEALYRSKEHGRNRVTGAQ